MHVGNMLPYHAQLGPKLHHPTLFEDFMVGHTVVVVRKGRINVSFAVNWVTCNGNVL